MKSGSFNKYGPLQRSGLPSTYRDGKAPRTPWCIQCGIQRIGTPAVGVDEDDQPACQQRVAKPESEPPTPEPAEVEAAV